MPVKFLLYTIGGAFAAAASVAALLTYELVNTAGQVFAVGFKVLS